MCKLKQTKNYLVKNLVRQFSTILRYSYNPRISSISKSNQQPRLHGYIVQHIVILESNRNVTYRLAQLIPCQSIRTVARSRALVWRSTVRNQFEYLMTTLILLNINGCTSLLIRAVYVIEVANVPKHLQWQLDTLRAQM